jgi:hypothetical protein
MIPKLPDRAALIKSFVETGLPEETAADMADELLTGASFAKPGLTLVGIDAAEIPTLVHAATRAGAKSITLEIRCVPDDPTDWYHFAVKVLALEHWKR